MTRVVVLGGGIAGLTAARGAVLAGGDVTVLESSDRLGGAVAGAILAGIPLDVGAESIAARGTAALGLLDALGLETVAPAPAGAWLHTAAAAHPLPGAGIAGIPGSPLAADVRSVLGTRAALRAWADRVLPELSVGRAAALGPLVRRRMGAAVLEKLVAPVVENVYAIDPDEADVEAIAPGLNGELTRAGSLSAAVLALRASAPAGSAVRGIRGGVHLLAAALASDLARFGVDVRRSTVATAVARTGDAWTVSANGSEFEADRVVVATWGSAARDLLAPHIGAGLVQDWPEPHRTVVVALVVDAPALDAHPRGSGVLVARDTTGVGASALTHSTAKWPWLAETLPPSRHVLRLSYRGAAAGSASPERALADASTLLGVPRADLEPVDSAVVEWRQESSRVRVGMRQRIEAVRGALAAHDGLEATGTWLAGTGLAAVIADAQAIGGASGG